MSSEIRAKKKQSSETPSLITSLPDDIIYDIIARVPRCNYPNLSLVSKHFESLIASSELYARRSLLGRTEPCIYGLLLNESKGNRSLYVLANSSRLVLIRSLPPMSFIVAVGSKIYVLGGIYDIRLTTTMLSIDCRSHAVQPLPSMPMPMVGRVADIIDGKIYVIGYSDEDLKKKVMAVFDTETQMWEPEMIKVVIKPNYLWSGGCVVMEDKIYVRDSYNSFIYEPKENKWRKDEMLNSKKWHNACLVDNILYYYDYCKKKLRAYDPKQRLWREVKGVGKLLPDEAFPSCWSRVMNYGGKLAVLHGYNLRKIWCTEISLERRQGGEIWGEVEWSNDFVLERNFLMIQSLVVIV